MRILIALLSFFAVSCAVKPPMSFDTKSLDENKGVLIGSFTRINGKPRFNQYSFYFVDSNGQEYEITIKPELITTVKYPDDFDNGEVSGSLFAFTLPSGEYFFNKYFNLYQVGIGTYRGFVPSEKFSLPFYIKPGQVAYIGEIRFYPKLKDKYKKEPKFPIGDYANGGLYKIHDSFERDIKLFSNKYKFLDASKVDNITLKEVKIPILKEI